MIGFFPHVVEQALHGGIQFLRRMGEAGAGVLYLVCGGHRQVGIFGDSGNMIGNFLCAARSFLHVPANFLNGRMLFFHRGGDGAGGIMNIVDGT